MGAIVCDSPSGAVDSNSISLVQESTSADVAANRDTSALNVSACPSWKRTMDLLGACIGLVLLLPVFVGIGLWIKLVSRGPVFFRQRRFGLAGRPFCVWKFRTLDHNEAPEQHCSRVTEMMAKNARLEKHDRELPVIYGGKFLRKLGLDELPQLFNVLGGEMSLVGPRPDVVPMERYAEWQRHRFDVNPGITGLWQVKGKNHTSFTTMMMLDVDYIQRRSLGLDLIILLQTIPAIMRSYE
jgi:lipopolysaccharide/colanic/teichoic acid biosynthesis glycosyltransferase